MTLIKLMFLCCGDFTLVHIITEKMANVLANFEAKYSYYGTEGTVVSQSMEQAYHYMRNNQDGATASILTELLKIAFTMKSNFEYKINLYAQILQFTSMNVHQMTISEFKNNKRTLSSTNVDLRQFPSTIQLKMLSMIFLFNCLKPMRKCDFEELSRSSS